MKTTQTSNKLLISEFFYSIQGEGPTQGTPSVFVRFTNCNLSCGITAETLSHATKFHTNQLIIEQNKMDQAKWVCDTIAVWLKGQEYTPAELFEIMDSKGYISHLTSGAHLILTGGEPTMNQTQLVAMLKYFNSKGVYPYTEIETNGTIVVQNELSSYINQYNVSLKLANSGMISERREKPDAIKWFASDSQAYFKFVILDRVDIAEVVYLIHKYKIDPDKVYLMPGATTRDELITNSQDVAEICKETGYRFSTRMQLEIWNKKVGV